MRSVFHRVLQLSVCRSQWNGCVEGSSLAAATCVILLRFAAESRKSHCNRSVRRVNGALATDFFRFWHWWFSCKIPLKKCFKIVVFPLWRRDLVLELQIAAICGVDVRSHFYCVCNSVSADRSGMAASRFLVAAAACVILLRFAAESRKSHCNGSVRRVNGALGADFFDFGIDDFPFKIPFKVLQNRRFSALASRSGFGFLSSVEKNHCNLHVWHIHYFAAICGAVVRSSILQLRVVNPWEERAAVLLTFMAAFLRA